MLEKVVDLSLKPADIAASQIHPHCQREGGGVSHRDQKCTAPRRGLGHNAAFGLILLNFFRVIRENQLADL
jgi:hypothetical protein